MAFTLQPRSQETITAASDSEMLGGFEVLKDERNLIQILSYLQAKDLTVVARLNSRFRQLASDNRLWRDLCIAWEGFHDHRESQMNTACWRTHFLLFVVHQRRTMKEEIRAVLWLKKTRYRRSSFGGTTKGTIVILQDRPCRIVDIHVTNPGVEGQTKYYLRGVELFIGDKHEQEFRSDERPVVPDNTTLTTTTAVDYEVLHFDPKPSQDYGVAYLVNCNNSEDKRTLLVHQGARRILRHYCMRASPTSAVVVTIGSVAWEKGGKKKAEGILAITLKERDQLFHSAGLVRKINSVMTDPQDDLHVLPDELLLGILSFLEPRDLVTVARLNHRYHAFAFDDYLWKEICIGLGYAIAVATVDNSYHYFLRTEKTSKVEKKIIKNQRWYKAWKPIDDAEIVMLESRPCTLTEVHHLKPNRHGLRVSVSGLDFITRQPHQMIFPHSDLPSLPTIERQEYRVVDIVDRLFDSFQLTLVATNELLEEDVDRKVHRLFSLDASDDPLRPYDAAVIERIRHIWLGRRSLCHVVIQRVSWGESERNLLPALYVERIVSVRSDD